MTYQLDVEIPRSSSSSFPTLSFQISLAAPLAAEPIWSEVTTGVYAASWSRGRTSELADFPAGTASVTLDNKGGTFDPDNGSSPLTDYLTINRRARLVASYATAVETLFDMFVDSWPLDDDPTFESRATTITLTDAFVFLAGRPMTPLHPFTVDDPVYGQVDAGNYVGGPPVFRDTAPSGIRIAQILNIIGWPAELVDLDNGLSQIRADTPTDDALSYLQRIARSELGALFVAADGRITFRQRRAFDNNRTSLLTLADDDSAAPYIALTIDPASRARVLNTITRSTANDSYTAIDPTSVLAYGPLTDDESDLLNATFVDLIGQATYVRDRYADAVSRITGVTVDNIEQPTVTLPVMIAADIGDRLTVGRTPAIGEPIVWRDAHIEAVAGAITAPFLFQITWSLLTADDTPYFTVDDPTLGRVDAGIRYAY